MFDKHDDVSGESLQQERRQRIENLVTYADNELFKELTRGYKTSPHRHSAVTSQAKTGLRIVPDKELTVENVRDERLRKADYNSGLVDGVAIANASLTQLLNTNLSERSAITPEQAFMLMKAIYSGDAKRMLFDMDRQVKSYAAVCNVKEVDRLLENYAKDQAEQRERTARQR